MKKANFGNYSAFLEQKTAITEAFEAAISETIEKMGEDVKGVSFFSALADDYNEQCTYSVAA